MTRAALTKLLILVILIFIICLPDFFTLYRVSKVNFICLPYRPCERGNQVKKGENGKIGDADIRRKDMCDPSQTPGSEKFEKDCTQEHQSNTTDPESDLRRAAEDPEKSWFVCETDMDMAELYSNSSSSDLKIHLEVSVNLQLRDAETLNLTLYGRNNHSSLHLHPPEEEDEEEEEKNNVGQRKAFYCCLPAPPTPESANQRRCVLWLANQTVLTATAKEKLPWKRTQKDEWRCVLRVLWLAVLCVMVLTVVITVLGLIYRRRHSCKKPKVHPVGYDVTGQELNDGDDHTEINIPKGLSPIPEVDTQDEIETLLDGNNDHCYTANLHHRNHPTTSSLV
ncbi:uncharacterized protein LOC115010069 isoform X2 [Cottoperca gobio]|uniref:Uncharacterized protein LOC115010069 isoform X2 n=1 Tax=Cottoperca gobio TaxID=56716 RepID=A0A6J2PYF9_COTGO|nr:uncharacterized protein LOC115010069 isoform X2 [Cottoperca gobio]XP_029290355.1 uncharacterized protein LOC115010069 isoform X2 [Cottoperca gobio]